VTAALLLSIGILAVGLALCLRVLRRTGELRASLLATLLCLLALGQGALLAAWRGRPLAADLPSAAALAGLAAAVAALLVVRALATTLEELERAEGAHWGSMQGVRALTELAAHRGGERGERLAALLELGCERFGLEVGLLSRIGGDRYELHALRAPTGFRSSAGSVLRLDETLCRLAFASRRPVAVEHASHTPWARPPGGDPLGLEAYLGAPVATGGRPFGTLAFASARPRARRFTASEKDLLALMAQWVGFELERAGDGERRSIGAASEVTASEARSEAKRSDAGPEARGERERAANEPRARQARLRARGVDVNEALLRVESRIRDLVGPRVRLVVRAKAERALARDPGLPLESLLLTLVGQAVEAMPGGGTLTLCSGDLSFGYLTLSVAHTGRGPDAEALARAFDPARGGARDVLGLASLVQALRRGGGDLSVEVDPARGTSSTVFLPAEESDTEAPTPRATPTAAAH
jgi:signal transduction histidine kinase